MTECPVCLETIATAYHFNGCSHSICVDCSIQMKTVAPQTSPFSNNVTILLKSCKYRSCPCKMSCLRCPLCRTPENINQNMELLRINHRTQYDAWLDIELRWVGDCGYQHIVDTVFYGYSNKKYKKVHVVSYQSGDVVSHEDIDDLTPQTYRLVDKTYYDSYKDQLREHKRFTVGYKRKNVRKY